MEPQGEIPGSRAFGAYLRTVREGRRLSLDAARTLLPYEGPERRKHVDLLTLEEVERRHIERVLAATGGNRPRAARILGINVSTIYRKLEKLNLAEKTFDAN